MNTPNTSVHPQGHAPDAADAGAPVRVIVAEDSYPIRDFITDKLSTSPEVELVAVCSNATELQTAIAIWRPQVVLTDVRMPPSGSDEGVRIARRLRETNPEIGVVVLSQYAEPAYALGVLEDGGAGRGYLLKESISNRRELVRAIAAVARGELVIDPRVVDVLVQARLRTARSVAGLEASDRTVFAEVASGKSNAAIAESLSLSEEVVQGRVSAIFATLGIPEAGDVSRRVLATLIFLSEQESDDG
jgi:DNA-binding NarL/FixJ family response regulator